MGASKDESLRCENLSSELTKDQTTGANEIICYKATSYPTMLILPYIYIYIKLTMNIFFFVKIVNNFFILFYFYFFFFFFFLQINIYFIYCDFLLST